MSTRNVIRTKIKEGRQSYFVEYHPAHCGVKIAFLNLTFPNSDQNSSQIAEALKEELDAWLERYPVPVIACAYDAKEDPIRASDSSALRLTGYRDLQSGSIVQIWGIPPDSELPTAQCTEEYLASVYHDIPSRLQSTSEEIALSGRKTVMAAKAIVVFVVLIPLVIELISLGVAWLGWVLSAISIFVGAREVAKSLGWLKPSKRELERAETERRHSHYVWHCERNPSAFERLKRENFEDECIQRTRREAAALKMDIKQT